MSNPDMERFTTLVGKLASALTEVSRFWEDNLPGDAFTPETGYPFSESLDEVELRVIEWHEAIIREYGPDADTVDRAGLDSTNRTGGPYTWDDVRNAAAPVKLPMIGRSIFQGLNDSLGVDVYYPGVAKFVRFQRIEQTIVMHHPDNTEPVPVENPERFGPWGAQWVRNYFA